MQNRYKNYTNQALLFLLLALTMGSFFSSCDKDDEVNDKVELYSFGPMPIARGAELRFIGNALDKVTSIVLPDGIEISAANFTSKNPTMITLTVPQEAVEGYVVVKSPEGDITTKTEMGFSEPISIDMFAPGTIKPGAELTITGDYLNLVGEVIFTDRISVSEEDFVSHSREEIKLIVPAEAQTGKIAVSNGAEDPIIVYSATELTVVKPTITSVSPNPVKAGANLTVAGADLDLVTSIVFGGNKMVETFVSQTATSIIVTVPADAQDAKIKLTLASGLEVESADVVEMVIPTNVAIAASTRYKAGLNALISGNNLDLVTSIVFAGGSEITDFTFANNKITVTIPDNATNGVVTLNLASAKNVQTTAITLVKPTVTSLSPNPVSAGADFVIAGTDLDLVKSITFTGGVSVNVTATETSITVNAPVTASTGVLALNLANGTSVSTASLSIDVPQFCFIPKLPDVLIRPGELAVFETQNSNMLTEVQVNGARVQHIVHGSQVHVLMPEDAVETTDLKLISSNGSVNYSIFVTPYETTIWEGPLSITWGDGGRVMLTKAPFEGLAAGTVMRFYFTQTDNWGQAQINDGWWTELPFSELGGAYLKTGEIGDKSVSQVDLVLTQTILDRIITTNGIVIQGSDWIFNKIVIMK